MAESTTMVGSPEAVMRSQTCFILSGEPTDVPPNFITFIVTILYRAPVHGKP